MATIVGDAGSKKNIKNKNKHIETKLENNSFEEIRISWGKLLLTPTIISIIGFLLYFPSRNYNFQFDDLANIVKYFDIRNLTLSKIFFANPRWISYWLNSNYYAISKFHPLVYRLGNIFFHIATGVLVFYLTLIALSRVKKESYFKTYAYQIATFASALFVLHPVQTQTVSYVIQGQLEGLACFLIMASSIVFLQSQYTKSVSNKFVLYLALFSLLFLSCGTKEIAIVSPALILLVDWFFVAQGSWKSLKSRWLLHTGILLTVFSVYIYFLKPQFFMNLLSFSMEAQNNIGNVLTENQQDKILPLHYFISEFKVILHYIWIFIWPFNISVDYDWKMVKNFFAPDCILPFLILSSFLFIIYKRLQKDKTDFLSFAALWFFVAILPRASIIPSSELIADYKTYTASYGLLLILAAAIFSAFIYLQNYISRFYEIKNNFIVISLSAASVFFICYFTFERNKVWSSAENFWANIVKNAPLKARGYNNYGVALSENGKYHAAIPYFQKAIDMDDKYPDPCNNIAVAHSAIGEMDKAIEGMKLALKIQPFSPEAHNNIGSFYRAKKDHANAELSCLKAIALRKTYGKAHYNLGLTYYDLDKKELAYNHFKTCCLYADLDNETGFSAYAAISFELKKYDDLIVACSKLLELKPDSDSVRSQLAIAYMFNGDNSRALSIFATLQKKYPNDYKLCYNVAQCLFNLGQIDQALAFYQKTSEIPNCPKSIYLQIAECHKLLGNKQEAQKSMVLASR